MLNVASASPPCTSLFFWHLPAILVSTDVTHVHQVVVRQRMIPCVSQSQGSLQTPGSCCMSGVLPLPTMCFFHAASAIR